MSGEILSRLTRPRDATFRQDPRFVAIAAHVRGLLMHREAA